jgi:signal transduction histidine kinase
MAFRMPGLSLLGKILLSTSISLSILFAVTLVIVQRHVMRITYRALEQEVNGSFQAYDSLWRARAEKLATVNLLLSRMADVRRVFDTRDEATIRDSVGELWSGISEQEALFLVTDPGGDVIAAIGRAGDSLSNGNLPIIAPAAKHFPLQSSGFMLQDQKLYQVIVTPVYVDTAGGRALLNALVAGYLVDSTLAQLFKKATGGSEFAFLVGGHVIASTLPEGVPPRQEDYVGISKPLLGVDSSQIGELRIYRSFAGARSSLSSLLRDVYVIWLASILAGLGLTWWLARRILRPVKELDRAASQIAQEHYEVRVNEDNRDELGRLGRTFNSMCVALERARANLVRQERMLTISRLSTSIVHDLRNPLANIYGGAEILVDMDLPPSQVKRLAGNIYHSAAKLRDMLNDLAGAARGKTRSTETCNVRDVIRGACETATPAAEKQGVTILLDAPPDPIELQLDRARMERVFFNLITNALEAMPEGGKILIDAKVRDGGVFVAVEDTGRGIPPEIRDQLFEPLVTSGKKDGMGLGLAFSRQTVVDHGGDMWLEPAAGARFMIRLPY